MIFVVDVAGASDSVREPFDITTYIAGTGNGGFACVCLEVTCVYVKNPNRNARFCQQTAE